jgi:two-component system, OmpR family, response regulator CpxR
MTTSASARPQILLADDDRSLTALLSEYLVREGFAVRIVHDGKTAVAALAEPGFKPDVLVLDVMMPGQDGLDTLRQLRGEHALPVLMLSARGEPLDRIIGLELGADDYLAKPCLPRELLARIKSLLRRQGQSAPGLLPPPPLSVGALELKPAERRARCAGQVLDLTGAEFGLLHALMQQAGSVVDKATLTQLALGRELERFDRAIDVHVSRLRQKLAATGAGAPAIESVRGAGYQLVVPE